MARQTKKICQHCKSAFYGRSDAKTCSARCRKGLQRVQLALAQEAQSAEAKLTSAVHDIEQIIIPPQIDEAGFIEVAEPPAQTAPAPAASPAPAVLAEISPAPAVEASPSSAGINQPLHASWLDNLSDAASRPVGADVLPNSADIAPAVLRTPVQAPQTVITPDEETIGLNNPPQVVLEEDSGQARKWYGLGRSRVRMLELVTVVLALLVGSGLVLGYFTDHNKKPPAANGSANLSNLGGNALTADNQKNSLHINFKTLINQNFIATGNVLIQNDSTTGLQVQDQSGNNLLVVDTANQKVGVGGTPTGSAKLQVIGDLSSSGQIFSTQNSYKLNSQGLFLNGVLVCTATGCSPNNNPNLGDVARLSASQTFSGINQFTSSGNVFAGDGSGLSALNAGNITSGTLSDSRLSSNVALRNANNNFSGTNTFTTQIQASGGVNASAYSVGGTAGSTFTCASGDVLQQPTIQSGIITNGSCVAIAGGTTPTLQNVYDASIPAHIVLSSASGLIQVQDAATPLGTDLFEVTNNGGATKYFAVSSSGIAISGNVNATGQYQVNGSQISSANLSDSANLAKLNGTQTFTGANTFNNASNSFTGDGSGLTNLNASNFASGTLNDARLSSNVPLKNGNNSFTGYNTFQNSANSTTAFQIQNAAGTSNLLIADTTNTRVGIGKAPTLGALDVNGAIYQSGNQVCDTSGNCSGVGGVVGGSGTAGTIAVFTGSGTTIGNSNLSQSGTTTNAAGNFNLAASSQYQINGSQISSANLSNDANLAKLNANQTFTGNNTFSSASNSFTGNGSGLTSLNASNISSGTLNDARLSANVPLKNTNNTFTAYNTFQNSANSTTAFQIQNAAGTSNLFIADTTNNRIAIDKATASYNLDVGGSINGTTVYQNGNQVCDTSGNCVGTGGSGAIGGSGTAGTLAVFTGSGFTIGNSLISQSGSTVTDGGNLLVNSNSATGFQVQNSVSSKSVLTVDTSSNIVGVGTGGASGITGDLQFNYSGQTGNITLIPANPSSTAYTLTLPAENGTICTTAGSAACASIYGSGSGSTTTLAQAYNNGSSAANQTLSLSTAKGGGLDIQDAATTVGNLFTVQNNAQTTNYFNVTSSGIGVIGSATVSGNVNSSGGAIQTNSVTRLDNSGNLTNIGNFTASAGTTFLTTGANGFTFKPGTNNTTAFQVQNAGGGSLLNVDSLLSNVTLLGLNDGQTSAWTNQSPNTLQLSRQFPTSVTANGYVYALGGAFSTVGSTNVQYAKLNSDGSTGAWTSQASNLLPAGRMGATSVVYNGYVYVLGGYDGTAWQNTVFYARLNTDGSTGPWVNQSTNLLPAAREFATSVVYNGYVYVIGGTNGGYGAANAANTVFYAKLNADGSTGAWTNQATNLLPAVRYGAGTITANGYVYVLGGHDGTATQNTVFYARLNTDGSTGAWTNQATNLLPASNRYVSSVLVNGYAYILGGCDNSCNNQNTVFYAKLNADGSTGAWTNQATNLLPAAEYGAGAIANNGYIYMLGGFQAGSVNAVYYASTSRVKIGGSLDLVGIQGQDLSDPGSLGIGSSAGSILAGDITAVGNLQVQGQANFAQNVGVNGNVTVGGSSSFGNNVQVQGNVQVSDNTTSPTKSYRFRTSGSALDFEGGGAALYISEWQNANFTGTQYFSEVMQPSYQPVQFGRGIDIQNSWVPNGTNTAGFVPLTVSGVTGQTADLVDVKAAGVANPLVSISSSGVFQVQNSSALNLLTVDNTGNQVVLGMTGASGVNGKLLFDTATAANYQVSVVPGSLTASYTLQLPALAAGTYNICTDSGNCNGAGATLQTAYNNSVGGSTPEIKLDSTRGSVDIQDAATPLGANLFTVQSSNGATNYLAASATGISVTGSATVSGTYNTNTFDNAGNLTFGNAGAASINATSGQNLNLGTGASNHTTTLGSTNGTSTTTVQSGSGGISLNGNVTVAGTNTFTVNGGNTSLGANLDVTSSVAYKHGVDISTTGTLNDLNIGNVSLIRLSGASAQTLNGIAGGRDGYIVTVINAGSANATIADEAAGDATAANRIRTGTGGNISVAVNSSITLVYDSQSSRWRVIGDVAGGAGAGVTSIGTFTSCTSYANGAQISSNTLTFSCADISNPGMVSTGAQTWAGAKTFNALLTGNAGITVTGGAVSLTGNAASSLSTTSGTLTLQGDGGLTASTTNKAGAATAGITIASGNVTSGAFASGSVSIDVGTSTGSTGTVSIGTGNASAISIGLSGKTTTVNGALTVSQTLTANGGISIGSGQSISFVGGASNFDQSASSGTFKTGSGNVSLNGATTVTGTNTFSVNSGNASLGGELDVTKSLATKKGSDYSSTGTQADINFGDASLIRITSASALTIAGIANGRDGYQLTLVNASSNPVAINNNDTTNESTAANRILTGTGQNFSLAVDSEIVLVYDAGSSRWRMNAGSSGVTTIGTIDSQSKSANGAVIVGNTVYLQTADASFPGLVSTSSQTWAGAKTFNALITGSAGLTVSGAAISLNDSSNFATNINTGTSTGAISIGNSAAGAITLASGTASSFTTNTGNITIQAGSGTVTLGTTTNLTASAGLTVASGGSGDLTLNSVSGTLKAGSNTSSILFTNSGTASIDATSGQNLNLGISASNHTTTLGSTNGTATTTIQSGSGGIGLNGNTAVSGSNTFATGTGNVSLNGNTTVAGTASLATTSGSSFTAPGTSNNAALNIASFYLLNTSGAAQVINGITAGRDGQYLTLTNINASSATLSNNSGSATGSKIITGTGTDLVLQTGSSANLIYDNANSIWRVVGSTGSSSGNYIQNQNASVQTANFRISGTGEADTSFLTPGLDALSGGALALGGTNATGVTIGGTTNTTSIQLQGATAATYTIGTAAGTGTITLGQSTAGQTINIGHAQVATGNTQTINVGDQATGTGKDIITIGNTNGASSLTLQGGSGNINLLTSSGNLVQVGSSTTDANSTLLALDSYNQATDPTGVAGAMYYNTNLGKFRCYTTGWVDCDTTGAGSGVTTVGAFSASSQTNGATISGTTITFGPADTTNPGMVSTGTQTFAGDKTFKSTTNSATAFQVQNNSNANLLNADAANMRVGVDVAYSIMGTGFGTPTVTDAGSGSLTSSSQYYYKITAIDSLGGETTASAEGTIGSTGHTALNISWTAISGASGYKVYRSTSTGSEVYYTTVLTNSFKDTGQFTAGSATPPASNTAYTSTNNSNNLGQISIGGLGSPTGQAYIGGILPKDLTSGGVSTGSSTGPYSVYVQGRYAYVADFSASKLQVFDVSNPAAPSDVTSGGISTGSGNGPISVYVRGRYAYIADNLTSKFQIFDVSKPTAPVDISGGGVSTFGSPYSVYVQGRYAYIAAYGSSKLQIFDVSNPAIPTNVGNVSTAGGPQFVYVQGRYAYVANYDASNFQIFDVSNPASPTDVSGGGVSTGTSSSPTSVYVQGRYAYVTDSATNKLMVFDISNPSAPRDVTGGGFSMGASTSPWDVYVEGRYAYISDDSGKLQVVDVSNPSAPVNISGSGVSTGANSRSIFVSGRYAYVVDYGANEFQVFDLGGEYTQQLEAGGAEVGTLSVDNNSIFAGDIGIQGGTTVGQSMQVNGNIATGGSIAIQGTGSINVTYSLMSTPSGVTATLQSPVTIGTATFSGTPGSSSYSYEVVAITSTGNSAVSSAATTTATANAVLSSSNTVAITWTSFAGNAGYLVYRTAETSSSMSLGLIGTAATGTTSFTDNGQTAGGSIPVNSLTNNTAYYYKVSAIDAAGGETAASSAVCAVATSTGSKQTIDISWNTLAGAYGYKVYRVGSGTTCSTDPGTEVYLTTVVGQSYGSSGTMSFTDTGAITAGTASPLSTGTAKVSSNNNTGALQLSIGGFGTPTGQLYVSGAQPLYAGANTDANLSSGVEGVVVQGRYAYVASNSKLNVYDVSNPSSPTFIGQNSDTNITSSHNIAVQGHYAYLVDFSLNNLLIYDISNPASPTFVSKLHDGPGTNMNSPIDIAVQGRYAYILSYGNSKLDVYDVSNPASPSFVGKNSDLTLSSPQRMALQGRYAYVANYVNNNIAIYDLSNPASPTLAGVSTDANLTNPFSIAVQGRYAYVGSLSATKKLVVYDISNPAAPTYAGQNADSNLGTPEAINIQGRYAYVETASAGNLMIYDISNPASPTYVTKNTDSNLSGGAFMSVQGRYAYISDNGKLMVYDLGGEYSQQLAAGGAEFGTLQANSNAQFAGDVNIQGGLSVGQAVQINGNVGVGGALSVDTITNSGEVSVHLSTTTATERLCSTITNGVAGMAIIRDCTGTPGDYAEDYGTTDPSVSAGEVVALDPSKPAVEYTDSNGYNGSKAWVVKASSSNQSQLLGVVSTNPNDVIGQDFATNENPRPVSLNGRVPVKVNTQNGAIQPGDYLVPSSTAGEAMRAISSGWSIGVALSGYSGSGTGTIYVSINRAWYTAEVTLQGAQSVDSLIVNGDLSVAGNATFQGNITINGHIIGNPDSGGVVTISTGNGSFTHTFTSSYASAPKVVISPESDMGSLRYWVTKTANDFTVHLSGPAPSDINFDYFVQQ